MSLVGERASLKDPIAGTQLIHAILCCGAIAVLALCFGSVAGRLAAGDTPVLALILPLLAVPVLLWCRPLAGLAILFTATIVIEQFDYSVGPRSGTVTARVPFFHSVTAGVGLTAAEVLLAMSVLVWVMHRVQRRERLFHASPLANRVWLLCGLAVIYLVIGLARGGDYRMALWEARPFVYLTAAYVLAASLLTSARAVRGLMWVVVIGCGVKAAYGTYIWSTVRHLQPRPEAMLAHEESFFFGVFVFLTLALWTFQIRGRLRTVATALLPLVVFADMCNSRRTAWAILLTGSAFMLVIGYVRLPHRRPALRRLCLIGLIFSAVYLPAYWNQNGTLAQPARAIRSVIAPDLRDEQSNEYRYIEDANIMLNIQARHGTGTGFGHEINYVIGMVDLRSENSGIAYIPHNGVLYVWMRMGIVGEIALWLFVLAAISAACRLTARGDRETAMFGAVVACAVMAYVILGAKDMGFTWFRIALFMGFLLGAVEARTRTLSSGGPRGSGTERTSDMQRPRHSDSSQEVLRAAGRGQRVHASRHPAMR